LKIHHHFYQSILTEYHLRIATHKFALNIFCSLLLPLWATSSGAAHAQSSDASAKSDWQFRAGVGVKVTPKYPGAENTRTRVMPFPEARYQDWLTINTTNGIEVKSALGEGFSIGASAGADLTTRRVKDDARFQGFADIKAAPVARIFADYSDGDFSVKAALKSRAGTSAGRGTTLEIDAGYKLVAASAGTLTIGFIAVAMDNKYAANFFGISPEQSQNSGLQQFDAKSGLRDTGVYARGVYRLTARWSLIGSVQVSELASKATDSPIVVEKRQTSATVFSAYTF
jgi:MipA family protein